MVRSELGRLYLLVLVVILATLTNAQQTAPPAVGGSFRVQCPATTPSHPNVLASGTLPVGLSSPAYTGPSFTRQTSASTHVVNGAIKCQEISGGDGYMTEADGSQTFLFGFGPLSGLGLIQNGQPGTQIAADFNQPYNVPAFINGQPNNAYDGTKPVNLNGGIGDPAGIMNTGVMNANLPAPLIAIDEDDEFFLTLSNVGMVMRPDLFGQHTVHFHGYPNASAFYDGVPDASIAINIGGSFTYYYLAPDAGTYFWHCHITPPEHLQMGMVGQLYVRPRQNRVPVGNGLYAALHTQQTDPRTACNSAADILCSSPVPAATNSINRAATGNYAYNDGDASTYYDVEYPLQIHGFDPNFHFVGMTFNPEGFSDMKDKYFLLNGRSYPDTVTAGSLQTVAADGKQHFSQPLPSIINIPAGKQALR